MNNNHKELHKEVIDAANSVHLSAEEKNNGRNTLLRFINTHQSASSPVKSPYFSSVWMRSGAVALILLVIMGGTAFAAQGSLPGDVLYPVKIHFNEGLESLVTFGAQNNAKLNALEIQQRLGETEVLSAEGRLSPAAKAELSASLLSNTEDFDQQVAEVAAASDTPEALSLTASLDATLQLHTQALNILGITSTIASSTERWRSRSGSITATSTTVTATSTSASSTPPHKRKRPIDLPLPVSVSVTTTTTSAATNTTTITEPSQGPVIRIYLAPDPAPVTVTLPTVTVTTHL